MLSLILPQIRFLGSPSIYDEADGGVTTLRTRLKPILGNIEQRRSQPGAVPLPGAHFDAGVLVLERGGKRVLQMLGTALTE